MDPFLGLFRLGLRIIVAVGCASTSPWDLLEWSQFLGQNQLQDDSETRQAGEEKNAFLNQVYMLKWNFLIDYTESIYLVFFSCRLGFSKMKL